MAATVGGRFMSMSPVRQLVAVQSNKPSLASYTVEAVPRVRSGPRGFRAVSNHTGLQSSARGSHLMVSWCSKRAEFKDRARAVSEEAAESVTEEKEDEEAAPAGDESPATPATGIREVVERYRDAVASGDETGIAEAEAQLEAIEKDREYLSQQVASLTEEVGLGKERFLRLNADFDNFRKRAEREKVALTNKVRGDVVEALLPMVDAFERAKTAIKAESDTEKKIDNSYQGIYKQFVEAMKSLGVGAVETSGKEFDPNLHEAIMREDSTEYSEGYILEEFRKGFTIGDKLLRAAMVKVSAGPGPSEAAPPTAEPVAETGEGAAAADGQ